MKSRFFLNRLKLKAQYLYVKSYKEHRDQFEALLALQSFIALWFLGPEALPVD
jgi:hypothetical protein